MENGSSAKISEETIYESLKDCFDPEIPVDIVNLGLVYGVTIVDDWVGVKMTLTTPGCGAADWMQTMSEIGFYRFQVFRMLMCGLSCSRMDAGYDE